MTICPALIQKYYNWLNYLHFWALAGPPALNTYWLISNPTELEKVMLHLLPQSGKSSLFFVFVFQIVPRALDKCLLDML